MAMWWIWCGMVFISVVCAAISGNGAMLTPALLEGAQSGVGLCVSIAGAICLWSALARLMEQGGLLKAVSRLLRPILGRLFPEASQNPAAFAPLCANVCANLLGLGNAATPLGIAAVQAMKSKSKTATNEMCRLIVMNTASIQLLPTTVAALRSAAGAPRPFAILPAVWATSVCSVCVGLAMCWVFEKWA